jgi:hypothetical protein
MSGYIGTIPVPQATQTRQTFTATSGQTSFATIGYVAGGQFIQVYLNGVLLKLTDDYTAANGSDIVLTSGAATGDILEFITFADFTVNNQNFTGGLTVDNDGATVLTVDRATSDGTIIDVQKSGSSVGSIGTLASGLNIGTGDTGLQFSANNDAIYPFDPSSNNIRGDLISLGDANGRFTDLYLSGGVFLGGTGSANKLDDAETGTFTPSYGGTGSDPTATYLAQTSGHYTKIGDLVHCQVEVRTSAISGGSGNLEIKGFPFAANSLSELAQGAVTLYNITFNTSYLYTFEMQASATHGFIRVSRSGTTSQNLDVAGVLSTNPALIRLTVSYKVI